MKDHVTEKAPDTCVHKNRIPAEEPRWHGGSTESETVAWYSHGSPALRHSRCGQLHPPDGDRKTGDEPLIATAIPVPPTAGTCCPLGARHMAVSASAEANHDVSVATTRAGCPPTEAPSLKWANSARAAVGCRTNDLQ